MILRLALAYGVIQALLGSVVIVLVAVALGTKTIGVTLQPLPMIWPVSILLVVAAQLPLREIFGPLERAAERAVVARALRAVFALLLILPGTVIITMTGTDPTFPVFVLLLTAIGFFSVALTRSDPWVWTLALGMGWLGLMFLTPMGARMDTALADIGIVVAAGAALLAAAIYVRGTRLG